MLLRFRNQGRDFKLALLAVALLMPATAVHAVQDAELVGDAEKAGAKVQQVMTQALDPEGLAGTPNAMTPPPILAKQEQVEVPSAETTAPQSLEPRVAAAPPKQEGIWQVIPESGTYAQPMALSGTTYDITPPSIVENETTYQTPQLRMTTLGPQQANIHRPSQFRFRVINDGPAVAEGVNLAIDISGSGRVVSTFPEGGVQQTEAVYFRVGDMKVGEIKEFGFEFQADQAGPINVNPRLTTSSTSKFTANVTAPKVDIDIQGEQSFVVGQKISQRVEIRNDGQEIVRNIVVRHACTPSNAFQNVAIADGQQIIDAILPGQSRWVDVYATAVQQGNATMKIVVDGENVRGSSAKQLSFMQSQLTAVIQGPELTYLNSMGTYAIRVSNDQGRDLENVRIRASLPLGMVVKVVDRKAEFDAASSSIAWTIPKLEAGQTETIPFKATLSQFGQHMVKISVSNDAGAMTHAQMTTQAVGRADIDLKVITNPEPIEIGSMTSVIVQIQNRGTQPANDVAVNVTLPDTIKGIESADFLMSDQEVTFDTFRLAPGQTQNLTIPIKCETAGDHIIRASVQSSASSKAIAAENSLFFFSNSTTRNAGYQNDR